MDTTQISKLKQEARTLKRQAGVSHAEALDQIAKNNGAHDWAHLMRSSGSNSIASSVVLATRLDIPKSKNLMFHRVQIEGMEFSGSLSRTGTLYIASPDRWDRRDKGVSYLGACRLHKFEDCDGIGTFMSRVIPGQWWLCKHRVEPNINISDLSDEGRSALAIEFGVLEGLREREDGGSKFLSSPAFVSLCEWTRHHPRIAKSLASQGSYYVPNWYDKATQYLSAHPRT